MKSTHWEILFGVGLTAWLLFLFRGMLFFGTSTIIHDNLYTEITGFHFLAENLLNGNFPLWDPYSFGGQPFAPLLLQLRLLDPVNWVTIFFGSLFTKDTVILFHWSRVAMMWLSLLGVYACFRAEAKTLASRFALLAVLALSSMMFGSFRQPGLLHHFAWVPWLVFFGRRLFFQKDQRWANVFGFAFTCGVAWQCYFFAAAWIWILLLFLWAVLFHRSHLRLSWKKYLVAGGIILSMMGPNFAVWLQEYDFVYPLRMVATSQSDSEPLWSGLATEGELKHLVSRGIKVPHEVMVHSGFHGTFWDLIQHLIVDSAIWIERQPTMLRRVYQDAAGFIGVVAWVVAIYGVFAAKRTTKAFWLFALGFWGLLFLGPNAFLHEYVVKYYPPASFSRHTGYYLGHFQFALLYFFVVGLNTALTKRNVILPLILLILQMGILLFVVPSRAMLAFHWVAILGSAFFGLWLSRKYPKLGHCVFLGALIFDLFMELKAAAPLYAIHPHPSVVNPYQTNVQPLAFPNFRKAFPEQKRFIEAAQFMRGVPFWERVPSVLATPKDGVARDFTEALQKPRNNSYYQLTNLYATVHSSIPPKVMEKLFGIGEEIVQFRSRAVAMPFSRIEPHLKELGEEKGKEWLAKNVILNETESGGEFPPGEFSYEVKSYRHGAVTLAVRATQPGYLIWQDGFHRGWKALIGLSPVKVMRANGVFKAIPLPLGNHEVSFYYFPLGFLLGLAGWFLSCTLTIAFVLWLALEWIMRRFFATWDLGERFVFALRRDSKAF